jgi:hypothetical protein
LREGISYSAVNAFNINPYRDISSKGDRDGREVGALRRVEDEILIGIRFGKGRLAQLARREHEAGRTDTQIASQDQPALNSAKGKKLPVDLLEKPADLRSFGRIKHIKIVSNYGFI